METALLDTIKWAAGGVMCAGEAYAILSQCVELVTLGGEESWTVEEMTKIGVTC